MRILFYLVIGVGIVFLIGLEFLWLSPDYNIGTVESGSMSPALNPGDLVITTRPQEKIKPGIVVIYNQGNEVIIHRVVKIEDGQLKTKGDAQEQPDQWLVPISGVKGVYLFKIPRLGYLASFIGTPFYQVSIGMFFIALIVVYGSLRKKEVKSETAKLD